jgi:hypothetical protein
MFRRALEDMAVLRFPIEVADRKAFMPAAELPWFIALFGRDALIVSLQNILIYPHFAHAALESLGSLQATVDDPYRDAEQPPGSSPVVGASFGGAMADGRTSCIRWKVRRPESRSIIWA